jgi:hypothetical protein
VQDDRRCDGSAERRQSINTALSAWGETTTQSVWSPISGKEDRVYRLLLTTWNSEGGYYFRGDFLTRAPKKPIWKWWTAAMRLRQLLSLWREAVGSERVVMRHAFGELGYYQLLLYCCLQVDGSFSMRA